MPFLFKLNVQVFKNIIQYAMEDDRKQGEFQRNETVSKVAIV